MRRTTHVLVTGAGRGTGRKLALAFAARGAHVLATARAGEPGQHCSDAHAAF